MSHLAATRAAPADADFVAYLNLGLGWSVAERQPDGDFDTVAMLSPTGYTIFLQGVRALGKSLWNYETRRFVCGDVGQLDGEV